MYSGFVHCELLRDEIGAGGSTVPGLIDADILTRLNLGVLLVLQNAECLVAYILRMCCSHVHGCVPGF